MPLTPPFLPFCCELEHFHCFAFSPDPPDEKNETVEQRKMNWKIWMKLRTLKFREIKQGLKIGIKEVGRNTPLRTVELP